MDMNEKPGQPSMEEILASIRRIIAEEPAEALSGGAPQGPQHGSSPNSLIDEGSEFELPSMFRPSAGPSQPEKPLFGRLTDALRTSAAASEAAGSAAVHGEPEPQPLAPVRVSETTSDLSSPAVQALQSLSSLRAARPEPRQPERPAVDAPAAPLFPMPVGAAAPAPVAPAMSADAPVKREMAPFKDTRFMRMSAPANVVIEVPAPVAPSAGDAGLAPAIAAFPEHPSVAVGQAEIPIVAPEVQVGALPVSQAQEPTDSLVALLLDLKRDIDVLKREQAGHGSGPVSYHAPEPAYAPAPPVYHAPPQPAPQWAAPGYHTPAQPPPLASAEPSSGSGSIEDTTAELLRPMLRQWLSENMPRMVEKALHIEVADSVKAPRKPGPP